MLTDRSRLTNLPPEVIFPGTDEMQANLAPEAGLALGGIATALHSLAAEGNMPDDEILRVLHTSADHYVDWFGVSLSDAIAYLDQPEPGLVHVVASEERRRRPRKGVLTRFREVATAECFAVGMQPHMVSTAEAERSLSQLLTDTGADLTAQFDKFAALAHAFGAPDVLRVETAAGAANSLEDLLERLERFGERPPEDTFRRRLKAYRDNSIMYTQEQFDRLSSEVVARYSVPTASKLLQSYVQQAMIYYAKLSFGEVPAILDNGIKSDSHEIFDVFQARSGPDGLTRPLFPSESAKSRIGQAVYDILYGDSPLSQLFDAQDMKSYQYSRREHRKEHFRFSPEDWAHIGGHIYIGRSPTSTWRMTGSRQRTVEGSFDDRIKRLDHEGLGHYIAFDQWLSGMTLTPSPMEHLDDLRSDFVGRLERGQHLDAGSGESIPLSQLLRRAIRDLHPDHNPEAEQAEELQKLYANLREELLQKNELGYYVAVS